MISKLAIAGNFIVFIIAIGYVYLNLSAKIQISEANCKLHWIDFSDLAMVLRWAQKNLKIQIDSIDFKLDASITSKLC